MGKLELPAWDPISQKKYAMRFLVLSSTIPDFKAFGTKAEVDPFVIFSAQRRRGRQPGPRMPLTCECRTPVNNDGKTTYRLTVKDVPVDGFWSVSLYNAQGYFEKNAADAYTVNNLTAKKSEDGSIVIQFGNCSTETTQLPADRARLELYRAPVSTRAQILNASWKFPEPVAVR